MKAVIQRVLNANVSVNGQIIGQIRKNHPGLFILLGVHHNDTIQDCIFLAKKIVDFRVFADDNQKMNKSILDVKGEILVVSQFTLYASWRQGRRPGFTNAAKPELGKLIYEQFIDQLKKNAITVATGQFGADMQITLTNDGPVTFVLDTLED